MTGMAHVVLDLWREVERRLQHEHGIDRRDLLVGLRADLIATYHLLTDGAVASTEAISRADDLVTHCRAVLEGAGGACDVERRGAGVPQDRAGSIPTL
jgi:hypothetical protein